MTADRQRLRRLAEHVLSCWNTHDVDQTVACYTSDLIYLDPNTRGAVHGQDAMRRYLTKLFGRWTMTWQPGEIFPLEGTDGVTIMWNATLGARGGDQTVDVAGIDLVLLDGDLVARNEVYFDRTALVPLLTPATT